MSESEWNGGRFGQGPPDADVMLVGQNPGKGEVRQGRPFVGRSGRYLDKVLQQNNIDRSSLHVTGVVKGPTPGNRKPKRDEIDRWMPSLLEEIEEVRPRIVVLMGRVAWETPRSDDIDYIETYHPAAAMRFPRARQRFEADMRELRRRMEAFRREGRG